MSLPISPAERLATLSVSERRTILADLSDEEAKALEWDWRFWARPNQLAPEGDWRCWLLLAGRGFGKTRTGAEWVRGLAESTTARRIALVAPTAADVRDVMIEGESGLLAISPPGFRPVYEPTKRRLTWPNGVMAVAYSADEPERLRGPQHEAAWCDELAAWRYPEAWDMLMLGLRLGANPRAVVTTTPKPQRLLRDLIADPGTRVTRASTYENRANLPPAFLDQILRRYQGTRLGRQELDAELIEDVPGALWTRDVIEAARLRAAPDLKRVVVAIDPAATSQEGSDETGIVVAGLGGDGQGYVLEDLSLRASPEGWARRAVEAYRRWSADRLVAEVNQGGDMVASTLRMVDPSAAFRAVRATRGKYLRAEPVSALYEQGRVHHVGAFPALEDQMCGFTRLADGRSPDRLDALVWAVTQLALESEAGAPRVRRLG